MPNQSLVLDDVFHALADPTRRTIVETLLKGPLSVSDLARPIPMALPSFMQHLKVLERSGLIATKKLGRIRTCEIQTKQLRFAEHWISERRAVWEATCDRLDEYLVRPDPAAKDVEDDKN